MRNLCKLLVLVVVLFTSFTSCEKDIVVIDAFAFEVEADYQEIATINYPQRTTLSILQEKPLEDDKYFFSYTLVEGQGAFIIDGSPVSQSEYIEIEDPELDFEMDFVSSSLGVKKVRVEINNNGKVIEILSLTYDVRHNPFSLTMTSPIVDYQENQVIPIKVNVQNVGVDQSLTYKRAFFLLEGEGELFAEGETTPTVLEQFLPIEEGESGFSLVMSTLGAAKLLVQTMDSNGQIKEAILEFTGFSSTLTFSVETNPSDLFVNANFEFDFDIPFFPGASGNKMSYVINSGSNLDVSFNSVSIAPNEQVDVPDSGTFSWTGVSSLVQQVSITFTLESNGDQISRNLVLDFQSGSFSFSAIPQSIDGNVNVGIDILGNITQSGTSTAPYSVVVTSDKSAVITYNGTDYSPGDTFSVGGNLNFTMIYKGLEQGTHALGITVFDTNGVPSNTVTFNMNFQP